MLSLKTMPAKYDAPFIADEFYHLFNRANSQSDKLFFQERNYRYFLQQWHHYLGDSLEVWSNCLIPNHFHFLVRVRKNLAVEIMELWRRFSISYTQAVNKQEQRRGSLFQEHPKHLHIKNDGHLLGLIRYIHRNPVHHGLTTKIESWRYSSYRATLSQTKTRVERKQVLDLFGSKKAFIEFHQQSSNNMVIDYCLVE